MIDVLISLNFDKSFSTNDSDNLFEVEYYWEITNSFEYHIPNYVERVGFKSFEMSLQ